MGFPELHTANSTILSMHQSVLLSSWTPTEGTCSEGESSRQHVPMWSNQCLRKWKHSRKPAVKCRTHDTDPSDTSALPRSRWRRVSQWHPPAQQSHTISPVFPESERFPWLPIESIEIRWQNYRGHLHAEPWGIIRQHEHVIKLYTCKQYYHQSHLT